VVKGIEVRISIRGVYSNRGVYIPSVPVVVRIEVIVSTPGVPSIVVVEGYIYPAW
jgi:hypothetical protein